jgi:phosphoribosylanthranilate isomerase
MRHYGRRSSMWVKICGVTRREDAMMAARLGADALGFIFTKSPRNVMRDTLSHWIREITIVEKVAVFMDESVDEILRGCEGLGIDTIQLHAAPSRDHERLVAVYDIIYAMDDYRPGTLPVFPCRILIDASRGRGSRGMWEERDFPYILAGGLNPDNVREAVKLARPAGVDVSSGVELQPGIKDPFKMAQFIREAKS